MPAGQPSELTVHLATPGTTDTMCAKRGVRTRGEVSCRGGRDVIINLKRWQLGVAWYPVLADYRDMVVNHEVGHFLGNGHAVCPRKGAPAPGWPGRRSAWRAARRNPWPYPDGRTYVTGPAAPTMMRSERRAPVRNQVRRATFAGVIASYPIYRTARYRG